MQNTQVLRCKICFCLLKWCVFNGLPSEVWRSISNNTYNGLIMEGCHSGSDQYSFKKYAYLYSATLTVIKCLMTRNKCQETPQHLLWIQSTTCSWFQPWQVQAFMVLPRLSLPWLGQTGVDWRPIWGPSPPNLSWRKRQVLHFSPWEGWT